jgi:ABC-type phosphate transport system permease subunit
MSNDSPTRDIIGTVFAGSQAVTEFSGNLESAEQKAHQRELETADAAARRLRENREHVLSMCFRVIAVLFLGAVLVAMLTYTGRIIADKGSSPEAQRYAFGIWGLVAGSLMTSLVSLSLAPRK